MNRIMTHSFLALAVAFFGLAGSASAEAKKPWKNEAEISLVSKNGNSKSTTLSAKEIFTYNWEKWTLELFGGALTSESEGSTTAEQYHAGEKLSYKITDNDYFFEKFRWDKDRFAGIDARYDFQLGYGRILLDLAKNKLRAEVGGGYISEERIGEPRNDFMSGRAFADYKYIISETAKFGQWVEYLHNFEDAGNFRFNAETSLLAQMTNSMSLKVAYLINHVGDPPRGFGKTDTTTTVSLIFTH